ncbi:MAG: hypothetical protein AAFX99_31195, partial [Myxococcota bacterium]
THRTWDGDDMDGFTVTVGDGLQLPPGRTLEGAYVFVKLDGDLDTETEDWSTATEGYIRGVERYYSRGVHAYENNPDSPEQARNYRYNLAYLEVPATLGGGWAFRIKQIHTRDDGTVQIETDGDHGLQLTDGVVEEVFLPSRRFMPDGVFSFSIDAGLATVDTPRIYPKEPFFSDAFTVTCETDTPGAHVRIATATDGEDGELSWQDCASGITVSENTTVYAYTEHAQGLTTPRPIQTTYTPALAAPLPSCLESGEGVARLSIIKQGLPELFGEANRITDNGLFSDTSISGLKVLHIETLLKVDEPGTYTFHYVTPKSGGSLTLDGRLLKGRNRGIYTHVASYPITVALEPGFHTLELMAWADRTHDTIRLEWEGPGFERRELSPTDLFAPDATDQTLFNTPPSLSGDSAVYTTVGEAWEAPFTIVDDGLPTNGALTVEWRTTGDNVVLSDPTQLRPEMTILAPGTHRLNFTASDGQYTYQSHVIVVAFNDDIGVVAEAEDAHTLTGEASIDGHSSGQPYSGTGFVILEDTGDTLELTVDIPADGTYALEGQYGANGNTRVAISYAPFGTTEVHFGNTGSSTTLRWLDDPIDLGELSAGPLTLTFECIGCDDGKAFGLDYLHLFQGDGTVSE